MQSCLTSKALLLAPCVLLLCLSAWLISCHQAPTARGYDVWTSVTEFLGKAFKLTYQLLFSKLFFLKQYQSEYSYKKQKSCNLKQKIIQNKEGMVSRQVLQEQPSEQNDKRPNQGSFSFCYNQGIRNHRPLFVIASGYSHGSDWALEHCFRKTQHIPGSDHPQKIGSESLASTHFQLVELTWIDLIGRPRLVCRTLAAGEFEIQFSVSQPATQKCFREHLE